jgi:hypothetical protein
MLTDGQGTKTKVAYVNYKLIGLKVSLLIFPDFGRMLPALQQKCVLIIFFALQVFNELCTMPYQIIQKTVKSPPPPPQCQFYVDIWRS